MSTSDQNIEDPLRRLADYAQELAMALTEPKGIIRKQLNVICNYFGAEHFFLLRLHHDFKSVFIISSDIENFDPTQIYSQKDICFPSGPNPNITQSPIKFGSIEDALYVYSIIIPTKSKIGSTYLVLASKEKIKENNHFLLVGVHGLTSALDKEEYDIEYLLHQAKNLSSETVKLLSKLTFSIDTLDSDTMFLCLVGLFVNNNLLTELNVDEPAFIRYLIKLRSLYNPVPYHNWRHAADATQFVFYFLNSRNMEKYLGKLDFFATLFSAICHDVEHNGYTNDFHRKTNSLFSQISGPNMPPLELHHADRSLNLLASEFPEVINNFSRSQKEAFMKEVFGIILATDMSKHKYFLDEFEKIKDSYSPENECHRLLLCQIIMKSADLSNTIRDFSEASVMAQKLLNEWYRQGDMEKSCGLPVTKGYDRETPGRLCDGQIGFYKYVSFPLVKVVAEWFGDYDEAVNQYNSNLKTWEEIASQ